MKVKTDQTEPKVYLFLKNVIHSTLTMPAQMKLQTPHSRTDAKHLNLIQIKKLHRNSCIYTINVYIDSHMLPEGDLLRLAGVIFLGDARLRRLFP